MSKRLLSAIVLGSFVAVSAAPVWAADPATGEKPAASAPAKPAPKHHTTAHKAAPKKSTTAHKTTPHKKTAAAKKPATTPPTQ